MNTVDAVKYMLSAYLDRKDVGYVLEQVASDTLELAVDSEDRAMVEMLLDTLCIRRGVGEYVTENGQAKIFLYDSLAHTLHGV